MADAQLARIDHFVVLMLENRSFDHLCGFLRPPSDRFRGLTGAEWNPLDAADLDGEPPDDRRAFVVRGVAARHAPNPPPAESLADYDFELFGRAPAPGERARNRGFVIDYAKGIARHNELQPWNVRATEPRAILQSYSPEQIPVIARLADEFALSDAWHASSPTPTFGNRFFLHAATSDGQVENIPPRILRRKSIFNLLESNNPKWTWNIYFHDFPQSLLVEETWSRPFNFHLFHRFKEHALNGSLPHYSFIEPLYFYDAAQFANDMHPPHDVAWGEQLIAEIYNALRAGPAWPRTLLLVLWDEHGGTYDHVAPPAATPPDGKPGDGGFRFDRFGVRVPALLVSPWVERGSIFRAPDGGPPFDHTSVIATLRRRFGLAGPLTARDAAAPTLADALTLDAPRDDTPTEIAPPPSPTIGDELSAYVSLTPLQEALAAASKALPASPAEVATRLLRDEEVAEEKVAVGAEDAKAKVRGLLAHLF